MRVISAKRALSVRRPLGYRGRKEGAFKIEYGLES